MGPPFVVREDHGSVAVLRLNRPALRNVLSKAISAVPGFTGTTLLVTAGGPQIRAASCTICSRSHWLSGSVCVLLCHHSEIEKGASSKSRVSSRRLP